MLVAALAMSLAVVSPGDTEIVVLGTSPFAKAGYTTQELQDCIVRIHPDIVAVPLPSDSFGYLDAAKRRFCGTDLSMEQAAINGYIKSAPDTDVRVARYDLPRANQRSEDKDVIAREVIEAVRAAHQRGEIDTYDKLELVRMESVVNSALLLGTADLDTLNRKSTIAAIQINENSVKGGIWRILNHTPSLNQYQKFWGEYTGYSTMRTHEMVKNLKELAIDHRGKRMLVLAPANYAETIEDLLAAKRDVLHVTVTPLARFRPSAPGF